MNVFPTLPGEASIPNTFHYLPLNIACAFDPVLVVMSKDAGCGGKKKRELFIYNAHCDGRVFVEVMYGARVYISCYMPVMPAVVSSSLFLPILQLSKEQVDQMQLLAQRAEAHGNAAAMMVCSNLFFWEFEKLLLRKNSGSKTCGY